MHGVVSPAPLLFKKKGSILAVYNHWTGKVEWKVGLELWRDFNANNYA